MKVKVYSLKTCSHCSDLKRFLQQNNIQFKEVDLSEDEKVAEDIIERSRQINVPVTEIDGKLIVGFNIKALKKALSIK